MFPFITQNLKVSSGQQKYSNVKIFSERDKIFLSKYKYKSKSPNNHNPSLGEWLPWESKCLRNRRRHQPRSRPDNAHIPSRPSISNRWHIPTTAQKPQHYRHCRSRNSPIFVLLHGNSSLNHADIRDRNPTRWSQQNYRFYECTEDDNAHTNPC